jgi:hypothetical protein
MRTEAMATVWPPAVLPQCHAALACPCTQPPTCVLLRLYGRHVA